VKGLLERNGFEILEWFGGHDGRSFKGDDGMMAMVARAV
jgi:hypothetical protein